MNRVFVWSCFFSSVAAVVAVGTGLFFLGVSLSPGYWAFVSGALSGVIVTALVLRGEQLILVEPSSEPMPQTPNSIRPTETVVACLYEIESGKRYVARNLDNGRETIEPLTFRDAVDQVLLDQRLNGSCSTYLIVEPVTDWAESREN